MIIPANEDALKRSIDHLKRGEVIALPTETVYGLAGDANSTQAVSSIYRIKGRPSFNPLIAHISDIDMAQDYVEIDPLSQQLMEKFWPGPLTLVLPLKKDAPISSLASAGLPTLAIRQPQGIFARIVARFGKPLVAPSANRSGRISPTSAQAVAQELGHNIPLILDGGPCAIGLESTILKVEAQDIIMLRAGGLARETIEHYFSKEIQTRSHHSEVVAPGMLLSHYAPRAQVRLNVQDVKPGENLLAFGKNRVKNYNRAHHMLNLSEQGDLSQAASNLFDYLRRLDEGTSIAVEPIPLTGLGEAINDRLHRASVPRPTK